MKLNNRSKWIASLLLSVVLSSGLTLVMLKFFPTSPPVVSFDLKGTVSLFAGQLADPKLGLSDEERSAKIELFSKALPMATAQYAKTHHVVIMVSPAVVSGAPDVTSAMQALIRKIEIQNKGAQ